MLSDAEFLAGFDAGTLDCAHFDHASHVRAAWLCLRAAPFDEAAVRVRRGLLQLATAAGRPERYDEAITVAYLRLIDRQRQRLGDTTWEEFRVRSTGLLDR